MNSWYIFTAILLWYHDSRWLNDAEWFVCNLLLCIPPSWWRHQMETFCSLLALCAGNSTVPGEFTAQRPVTRGFDVFFDLRLNKRLSEQSLGWWSETLSSPLWRHCNDNKAQQSANYAHYQHTALTIVLKEENNQCFPHCLFCWI